MEKFRYPMIGCVLAIIIALIVGVAILPRDTQGFDNDCAELDVDYFLVGEDGSYTSISVPSELHTPKNEWFTVSAILPVIPDSRHILYYRSSQQDVQVFVDGELRQEYTTEHTRHFGNSSRSTNVFIDINKEDSGKELIIKLKSPTSYSGTVNTIYYGTFSGVFNDLISKHGAGLIIAVILFAFGATALIVCIFLERSYHVTFSMYYASWTSIVVSLQALIESRLRQFYVPNMSLAAALSYLLVSMMPITLVMYVDASQKGRYKKAYSIDVFICFINFFINLFLHIFNIEDLLSSLTRSYILFGASFILVLTTLFMDIKKGFFKEIKFQIIGVIFAFILGFGEILVTILHLITTTGMFLSIGMGALLIFAVLDSISQMSQITKERNQAIFASNAKSEFLANMSHEVRTPINAIMGMDEMILRECKDEEILKYAADIKGASNNLLELINDILDFSKIESGKMELLSSEYSLSGLLKDVYNIIKVRSDSKDLHFNISANSLIPNRFVGDEARIRQILLNILNNAVKYTEKGSVTFSIEWHETIPGSAANLIFIVKDTGIGIKEEDKNKLFKQFERLDVNRNKFVEGTGLGLALTKRIVDLMKGSINVESEYGVGSTFTVIIPQSYINNDEQIGDLSAKIKSNTRKIKEYKESFVAPDAKILVVDDVAVNITVIKGLLKRTKVGITSANSGAEAIEICRTNKFDLILMDHMMPEMDGIETMEALKSAGLIECPIVVLTANAIEGMKDMYIEKGFDDYLSKPVNGGELEQLVSKYINVSK